MEKNSSYRRIGSIEYDIVRLLALCNVWWIGCKIYRNPIKSIRVLIKMIRNINKMIVVKKLVRAFKVDGKYVWDMFYPSWPSAGFNSFFKNHLLETEPVTGREQTLRRLMIAITKRCPLQCEHCSEAATLYNKDVLSYDQFIERIEPYVQQGVGQLVFSGGEPLSRYDDLLLFLRHFKDRCNQWIYTSGYGLTLEKAKQLKAAGLDGAAISLDHHLEDGHNKFRGNQKSYYWVLEAIKNLQTAGVFVAINVCPSKEYIESGGVPKLIDLCKQLGVPVINLLEPRAVGNYQDKDVELQQSHKDHLKQLSDQFNFNKTYYTYPTVLFPAGLRKTMPCGGGRIYMFLDYDGTLYPCPFCKVKLSSYQPKTSVCLAE
ncbi:radical SAM protein [Lacibacter sediminis]|uniref:Radical SAM protein n=1 Tax=Lacibacter sediminis TaxID=2760713 RepID=A0A7G5XGS4_9BACT|nr:radical SAM protein [Lacibacter sediminis]QNA44677.1 radical SAM protein [Lacibacter sediminis]